MRRRRKREEEKIFGEGKHSFSGEERKNREGEGGKYSFCGREGKWKGKGGKYFDKEKEETLICGKNVLQGRGENMCTVACLPRHNRETMALSQANFSVISVNQAKRKHH